MNSPRINPRRRFLFQAAAALGAVYVPALLQDQALAAQADLASGELFLIGDGARGSESLIGLAPYASTPGRIKTWRYGQAQSMELALPFFPHSFAAHPDAPHRVITFEKWGRHLAEVDLKTMSVVRVTQAAAGRRFFGHGAHAGRYFYATQMDDQKGRGLVAVMDSANHQVVHEFETQGVFPHDCQWLPGTNTLLIVNSRRTRDEGPEKHGGLGNHSSLVWLDVATGTCSKQVFIETPEFGYAHFARSGDGHIVLGGSFDAPKGDNASNGASQPLLSVIRPDDSYGALALPGPSLRGEVLSLYLNEAAKRVVATLPGSSRVLVHDYRSGEFIRQIEIAEPRGLAWSAEQHRLLVSSAGARSFLALDDKLALPQTFAPGLGGGGSHLCRVQI